MVHYSTGKKPERYSGKYFYFDKNFYKNVDVIRCNVSSSYNKSFFDNFAVIYLLLFLVL